MVEDPSPKQTRKRLYRFSTVGQALTFWFLNRPADIKKPSLWQGIKHDRSSQEFDPEARPPRLPLDDGLDPLDHWHKITMAIRDALRYHNSTKAREVFVMYWKVDNERRTSVDEIADKLGLSTRRVQQLVKEVTDEIENRLIRKGLLEPPDFDA
jgi:hypothetical protein